MSNQGEGKFSNLKLAIIFKASKMLVERENCARSNKNEYEKNFDIYFFCFSLVKFKLLFKIDY